MHDAAMLKQRKIEWRRSSALCSEMMMTSSLAKCLCRSVTLFVSVHLSLGVCLLLHSL